MGWFQIDRHYFPTKLNVVNTPMWYIPLLKSPTQLFTMKHTYCLVYISMLLVLNYDKEWDGYCWL